MSGINCFDLVIALGLEFLSSGIMRNDLAVVFYSFTIIDFPHFSRGNVAFDLKQIATESFSVALT